MRYPPAVWKGDGQSGGTYIGKPWRVVLHTTETTGVPGYDNGGSAPHLTYNPKDRRWTQHTDTDTAARALRNLSGGVETNRANALQVEIVCYSDKNVADDSSSRLWVGALPDSAYQDLRAFLDWCYDKYRVQAKWPGKQALSYSQANAAGFRMTSSEWNAFDGVCGHQSVTENDHWDPGALDWNRLFTESETAMLPLDSSSAQEDIRMLQDRLNIGYGSGLSLDGVYGQSTINAVKLNLGSLTGDPDAAAGKRVVARQWDALLQAVISKQSGGGGVSEARVKELIAASSISPG